MSLQKKNSTTFRVFIFLCMGILTGLPKSASSQDSLAFGDKEWISEGLMGKIYFIPKQATALPNFDTMKVKGTLYTKKIDVPLRHWSTGFPEVPGRYEWFGVVYTGHFKVKKPGKYIFRLLSDDGSKLFIDKKLIIDNDGLHSPASKLGEIDLDGSKHSIRVEYFQGPATEIALQLFATLDKESEQSFSSDNFTLITPPKKKPWTKRLIYAGAGLLFLLILVFWMRRKRRMPTA